MTNLPPPHYFMSPRISQRRSFHAGCFVHRLTCTNNKNQGRAGQVLRSTYVRTEDLGRDRTVKRLLNSLLGFLRSRALAADVCAASDGQLLTRFTADHDEDAFAALVCRHGPMVWCVCRRMLGNEADAEDAFQATFLVLAKKGAALARQDLLGGWLHGVACRTAQSARCSDARRRARERQVEEARRPESMSTPMSTENPPWTELRPVLDVELGRLPKKYQTAIVLCDLEGKSRREAARMLSLAEGTLSSRLARGRRLLARRLSRYAPGVAGGAVASALAAEAAGPAPTSLIASTIKAGCAFVSASPAAAGVISARAAALTEGVLKMMFLSRLKLTAGVLLAATIVCTGAGLFASGMLGGEGEPAPAAALAGGGDKVKAHDEDADRAPVEKKEKGSFGRREKRRPKEFDEGERTEARLAFKLKEELAGLKPDFAALGRQKVKAAKDALDSIWELYGVGISSTKQGATLAAIVTQVIDWSNALLAAELEISTTRSERLAALERHWLLAKKAEIITESNYKAGRVGPQELYPLRYHRIDAEIKLLKAREGK
jgi:RNA polymerase sigma factor (sigma-70 family)